MVSILLKVLFIYSCFRLAFSTRGPHVSNANASIVVVSAADSAWSCNVDRPRRGESNTHLQTFIIVSVFGLTIVLAQNEAFRTVLPSPPLGA